MNATLIATLCLAFTAPASTDPASVKDDVVMTAMRDELARNKTLNLPESEAPYYSAYTITDTDGFSIEASFGAVTVSTRLRNRMIAPTLRVGNYERDAPGFATGGAAPIDDNYDALRRSLWLVTDDAYKNAATSFREQEARDQQSTRDKDAPDSFTKRSHATVHLEPGSGTLPDKRVLEDIARVASAVFRDYPGILVSEFEISAVVQRHRFASSEGSLVAGGLGLASVSIRAVALAHDGAPVQASGQLAMRLGAALDKAKIVAASRAVADDLLALRKAPVLADYTGPILFEGDAGAQITAHMLSPRFSAGGWGADMEARLGQRVLPKGISLVDDPSMTELQGRPVFGHYVVDDEGVPARRVTLVDDGELKALLTTRKPTSKHPTSSGHARGSMMWGKTPTASNMVLRSRKGVSAAALEGKLRAQMKREGLKFAIIITDVGPSPWSPAVAYRVDSRGKRERVRLGSLEPLELRAFRDMLGTGKILHQFDYFASGGSPNIGASGHSLGFSAPSTVAAPSLLLREGVIRKDKGDKPKPPLYAHPHFAK